MIKKIIPTWYSKKLEKINYNYVLKQGIKTLFFDLDNTVASYQEAKPDSTIIKMFKQISKLGFKVYLISNNSKEKRVKDFAAFLKLDGYLFNAGKPKIKKVSKFINLNKLSKKEIVIIGDQLLTDVIMANSLKIRSILVEPKSTKDLPITRINRIIDKNIRKLLKKKKMLIDIGQDIK
jgi:HAD superfamily phosphatase (TIGR01668 family)